jgi:hypothetical protein
MTQAAKERTIFLEFVLASGLDIDVGSVQSRKPPEPDIICEIAGRGMVGFELTELIDQDFMARLGLMGRTRRHLNDEWQSGLSAVETSEFRRKYGNALLHFVYRDSEILRKRQSVTKPVLQALLRLPDDYDGTLIDAPEFLSAVAEVRVSRGRFKGPILDVDSSGWLGDPTANACLKKLSKSYECAYPVELLAYTEIDLLPPDDAWKAALEELADKFSASQFEKVWVFDRGSKSVRYQQSAAGAV